MKRYIFVTITLFLISCSSSKNDNRYSLDSSNAAALKVIDNKTSEVFFWDSKNDVWISIGIPAATNLDMTWYQANR
tara:strand:- start:375 stop:602 length:228 start_codon:yes stop_codon:yes gene_type:complete